MKTQDLSQIMRQAWKFVKIAGITIAEAMRQAWAIYKLKKRMTNGIVKFYYQKVSGEIREAYGTLKADLIPPVENNPDKPQRKVNENLFTYFDTEKGEFRSFKALNFVKFA